MRKIAAALAALLVLILGLVTSTAAAQDDRRAEGASVRASLVIRHVVQEGENLTTDDGLYGPGGIMQHYFGRHRRGDIARLRAYDGNFRAIRVARCDWPDEIPVEERTALQECPNAYATYTIRRAVGRTIEIPMRWVPSRRLAELLGVTPGVARDMRRIAASMVLPPGSGADDADDDMNGEDPLVDASTGAVAGTEPEGAPDAGTERLAEDNRDAGSPLAGGTGGTGGTDGHEHVGGGDAPSGSNGFLEGVAVVGSMFMACLCLFLLIAVWRMLWELVPMLAKDLWRMWRAFRRLLRIRANRARKPYDPETDPRTGKIRQQRDAYRQANHDLELEKAAALTRAGTAENERETARREKDAEQRDKNIAQGTVRKIAEALGLSVGNGKLPVNMIVDHVRQAAALLQKVAEWTQPANPWEFALAGDAFDLKLQETSDTERRARRAVARVRSWGKLALDRKREINGLNAGFSEHLAQSAAGYLALVEEKNGLVRRVIQTEDQLRAHDIQPLAWPPAATAPAEEPAPGLPEAPLEKPRRGDEKTEVVFGLDTFAREAERLARDAAASEALENAPTSAGFRIGDLGGAPEADELPGPAAPPEIAPDKTSPGVGLADVEGAPQGVPPPAPKRPTVGFEEMGRRGDQTGPIAVPPTGALPVIDPDADPDDEDVDEDLQGNGSGNGSSPPSHTQPVMCGCGKEVAWYDWVAHLAICPDADKIQAPNPPDVPPATEVRPAQEKRRRRRRKNSP
ncbi:hypothetical protein EPO33_02910 [Patescibacteria group bacterium]|nr:MAG: hypothetical protein EPO33_02910 [Patescibacteria group bacterium]